MLLLDYDDSVVRMTNSAFYSDRVTTSGPLATSKPYTQSNKL